MPDDDFRRLQEYAVSNRERIKAVEHELEHLRKSLHDVRAETQAIRFLAQEVERVAAGVEKLAGRVETIARQAVHRPTATGAQLLGQYLALLVSVVALAIVASR